MRSELRADNIRFMAAPPGGSPTRLKIETFAENSAMTERAYLCPVLLDACGGDSHASAARSGESEGWSSRRSTPNQVRNLKAK